MRILVCGDRNWKGKIIPPSKDGGL